MKIIVDTPAEKNNLIEESKYIHDFTSLYNADGFRCGSLIHLFMNPDSIEVKYPNTYKKQMSRYKRKGVIGT